MRTALRTAFLLMVCAAGSLAQTSYQFPGDHRYHRAKLFFKNNNRIEVSNLRIRDDHLTFVNRATSQEGEFDLKDVFLIKASQGSKAGEYALIGGAACGVSAAIGAISVESNPYYEDFPVGPWIAGWTAAGVLIGAIVGATQEKWKTVYANENASIINSLGLSLCDIHRAPAVGLQLQYPLR
ncbi:hypothetical protein KKH27_03825 [bacterium]|nr:hypothetical protein [bacterium]MBU1985059.1 hypothetical protein [bacterium]